MLRALAPHTSQKPPAGSQLDRTHPLAQGLVCFFAFLSAPNVLDDDLTGIAAPATFTGPAWATGPYGTSPTFPGSPGHYIMVPNSPLQSGQKGLTLAAWVNIKGGAGTYRTVTDKPYGTTWVSPYATNGLRINNLNSWTGWVNHGDTGANFATATAGVGTATDGTWRHIAMTYDLATLLLYLNGAQIASATINAALDSTTQPVYIGVDLPSAADAWNGDIAIFGEWNRALSPAGINWLSSEPFAMLQQQTYRRWFVMAGGTASTRTLSASAAPTISVARLALVSRAGAISVASASPLARAEALTRPLASSAASAPTVARALTLVRAPAATAAPSAATDRVFSALRAPAISTSSAATATRAVVVTRALASVVASSAALARVRALPRTLASTLSLTATATRAVVVTRALAATASATADLLGTASTLRILATTRSPLVVLARSLVLVRAPVAAPPPPVASLARTMTRAVALVGLLPAQSATLARAVGLTRPLATVSAPAAAVSRVGVFARALLAAGSAPTAGVVRTSALARAAASALSLVAALVGTRAAGLTFLPHKVFASPIARRLFASRPQRRTFR